MMPDVTPEYIEAVESVIENKDQRAGWEDDEMRSALLDCRRGSSMEDAAEERDFSHAAISRAMDRVEEVKTELEEARANQEGLFDNPVDDAVEDFKEFFDRMADDYGIEVNEIAVQLMTDEIRDNEQLPTSRAFQQFLTSVNSGVGDDKVWLLTRRYDSWLESYEQPSSQSGLEGLDMGMGAGKDLSGSSSPPSAAASGGVGVGGEASVVPSDQPQQSSPDDDRVARLESRVDDLLDELSNDEEESAEEITVEMPDGRTISGPRDDPAIRQALTASTDDGSDDMMSMLQQAKEAGLIVTPSDLEQMDSDDGGLEETVMKLRELGLIDDDGGEELASAVQGAISELGQRQVEAQQRMSENFAEALESMQEMQEKDDTGIDLEDVENLMEEKLSKSEAEQVREEMGSQIEELQSEVKKAARSGGGAQQDTEYLKKDREMQYQEKALETLNENVNQIPEAVASSVASIVPAVKELQSAEGSSPLWTPPGRGQPGYTPSDAQTVRASQRQQPGQQTQRQPQQETARGQATQAEQAGRPSEGDRPRTEESDQSGSPSRASESDAAKVRERLGLNGDGGAVTQEPNQ